MLHWELRKVPGGVQKALTASRNLCVSTSVSRAISVFLLYARICTRQYGNILEYYYLSNKDFSAFTALLLSDREFNAYDSDVIINRSKLFFHQKPKLVLCENYIYDTLFLSIRGRNYNYDNLSARALYPTKWSFYHQRFFPSQQLHMLHMYILATNKATRWIRFAIQYFTWLRQLFAGIK